MAIPESIVGKVLAGERLTRDDGIALIRDGELLELGRLADHVRRRLHPGPNVTYIIDRNINYTNVCVAQCAFCAFYRDLPAKDGYLLGKKELAEKIEETLSLGGHQILLQGGLHPDLRIEFYEELFRWIKATYPIWIHGLSPAEVQHIRKMSNLTVEETIRRPWRRGSTRFRAAAPRCSPTACAGSSASRRGRPASGSRSWRPRTAWA
jgi:cyclic dehypoxanthinyl futalosine synthase